MTLKVELGQGGRCGEGCPWRGECPCRGTHCAEGSQVRSGSEGCNFLFFFFSFVLFPLFFQEPPLGAGSGLIDTTKEAHEGK